VSKRVGEFLRSDGGVLLLVSLAFFIFHVATDGRYGFHRDELQTLDDARHLDWGFVVYPPIAPLFARLELVLFGTSLIGFRVFAALAMSAGMVLTGLMAREFGGGRQAQLLAAIAVGVSPIALAQSAVFQYVAFDFLWGVAATYFLVRLLRSDDPRWWIGVGAMLGAGMETRYTAGFLAVGIAAAVLLTPARRYLRSRWLWFGVALSVLLLLPNLIWQARHHFISLDFLSHIHVRDLREGRFQGFYREQPWVPMSPAAIPLALLGLWFFFVLPEGRPYRLLGWMFAAVFAMYAIAGARSYYTAPLYPVVIAAGSVLFVSLLHRARPAWRRFALGVEWAAIAAFGTLFVLLVTPVAPMGSRLWQTTGKIHDLFREEIGWTDLADNVAKVYESLSTAEREQTGILTGNYGEGGALNLYGPALGLPPAMCLTNSFWYRTYDPRQPQTVIVVGFDFDEANQLFDSCSVVAHNTNSWGVVNEESRDHPDILLCHHLRQPWNVYWQSHRRFG
jgi:4-amino-4-deoxy-L-arabinose transferase-like glycosyltransferase